MEFFLINNIVIAIENIFLISYSWLKAMLSFQYNVTGKPHIDNVKLNYLPLYTSQKII